MFVGAPPYLWFIENKNDKPGKFEVLLKGFGSQDTHETLNTFQWGPDGWLYGLHGIFTNSEVKPGEPGSTAPERRRHQRRHLALPPDAEEVRDLRRGHEQPVGHGLAQHRRPVHPRAAASSRTCIHIVPGGIYKRQAGASFNPYVYGYLNEICDHTFHKESGWAHAGLISLDVPHMPEKYPQQRDLRQHPRLLDQAEHPEAERLHVHRQPRRRLPGRAATRTSARST